MNKDINVTPDLEPTTNLGAFKFFALTNFPYIEQTFDTLTNYELMCKIVEELNKFIKNNNATNTNVINLYNAFVSLQDYVNQYFSDLNVQNEINNKLDQMASDGTLDNIINQEIFGQLNTDLTNLKNKVGNEALPSPDSSVSQNINILNNKINDINDYINTLNMDQLVIFGDSWTNETSDKNLWPELVRNSLNLNKNNYGQSGALICGNRTNDLTNQISLFTNSEIDKNKVKFIIILAGINDYRASETTNNIITYLNNFYSQLTTLCPNAKLIYISNCQSPKTAIQSRYWNDIAKGLQYFSCIKLDHIFSASNMTSNMFHLNEDAQKILAKLIINTFKYLPNNVSLKNERIFSNDDIEIYYTSQIIDNLVIINIIFKPIVSKTSYSITANDNLGNLDYCESYIPKSINVNNNVITLSVSNKTININGTSNIGTAYQEITQIIRL